MTTFNFNITPLGEEPKDKSNSMFDFDIIPLDQEEKEEVNVQEEKTKPVKTFDFKTSPSTFVDPSPVFNIQGLPQLEPIKKDPWVSDPNLLPTSDPVALANQLNNDEEIQSKDAISESELIQRKDWIKNARIIHKWQHGKDYEGTDKELGTWLLNRHSLLGNNFVNLGWTSSRIGSMNDEVKKAWIDSITDYENSSWSWRGFLKGAWWAIADAPTVLTAGGALLPRLVGAKLAGHVTRQAFKELLKKKAAQELKETGATKLTKEAAKNVIKKTARQAAVRDAKIGAAGGGIYGGIYDVLMQNFKGGVDPDREWSYLSTATNMLGGATLGGGFGLVPLVGSKLFNKSYMDEIIDTEKAIDADASLPYNSVISRENENKLSANQELGSRNSYDTLLYKVIPSLQEQKGDQPLNVMSYGSGEFKWTAKKTAKGNEFDNPGDKVQINPNTKQPVEMNYRNIPEKKFLKENLPPGSVVSAYDLPPTRERARNFSKLFVDENALEKQNQDVVLGSGFFNRLNINQAKVTLDRMTKTLKEDGVLVIDPGTPKRGKKLTTEIIEIPENISIEERKGIIKSKKDRLRFNEEIKENADGTVSIIKYEDTSLSPTQLKNILTDQFEDVMQDNNGVYIARNKRQKGDGNWTFNSIPNQEVGEEIVLSKGTRMKNWLKRNFTISSGLPKNIYELQRQTKDVIGIVERTLKAKESTYNKLLNKLKTTDGREWGDLTRTERRYFNSILNQMLKGKLDYINPEGRFEKVLQDSVANEYRTKMNKDPFGTINPEMVNLIKSMQTDIRNAQNILLDSGLIDHKSALYGAFKNSMKGGNFHLIRQFEIHDNKSWAKNLKKDPEYVKRIADAKTYFKNQLDDEEFVQLKDDAGDFVVPEAAGVKEVNDAIRMKTGIDDLTRKEQRIIRDGKVQPVITKTISEDLNKYRALVNKYKDLYMKDYNITKETPNPFYRLKDAFRNEFGNDIPMPADDELVLRYYKNKYENEGAERLLDSFLAKYGDDELEIFNHSLTNEGSFLQAIQNPSTANAAIRNIFYQRKDIDKAIRSLMGEYENPIQNYANTLYRLNQNVANYRYEKEIQKLIEKQLFPGITKGKLTAQGIPEVQPKGTKKLLEASRLPKYVQGINQPFKNPKHDTHYYLNEQLLSAIKYGNDLTGMPKVIGGSESLGSILKFYVGLQAYSRFAVTGLRVAAYPRNFAGAAIKALGAGNFSREGIKEATEKTYYLSKLDDAAFNREMQKYSYLGFQGKSTRAADLREAFADAGLNATSLWDMDNMGKGWKKIFTDTAKEAIDGKKGTVRDFKWTDLFGELAGKSQDWILKRYQLMDDYWKIYSYHAERKRYRDVMRENPNILGYKRSEIDGEFILDKQGNKIAIDPDDIKTTIKGDGGEDIVITYLDDYAAEKVRAHMDNYGEVARAFKFARRLPLADFLSYKVEQIRTTHNIIKSGLVDLSTGIKRINNGEKGLIQAREGVQRIGSAISAMSIGTALEVLVGTAAYDAIWGGDENDKEAIKKNKMGAETIQVGNETYKNPVDIKDAWRIIASPDFAETSRIIPNPWSRMNPKTGEVGIIDFSRIDPWAPIRAPFLKAIRKFNEQGDDLITSLGKAAEGLISGIGEQVGPTMVAKAAWNASQGKDEYGNQLPNYDDPENYNKKEAILNAVKRIATPGALTDVNDLIEAIEQSRDAEGKERKSVSELGGLPKDWVDEAYSAIGLPRSKVNPTISLRYKLTPILKNIKDANKEFRREINKKTRLDQREQEVLDAYRNALLREKKGYNELSKMFMTARRILPEEVITNAITRNKIFKKDYNKTIQHVVNLPKNYRVSSNLVPSTKGTDNLLRYAASVVENESDRKFFYNTLVPQMEQIYQSINDTEYDYVQELQKEKD